MKTLIRGRFLAFVASVMLITALSVPAVAQIQAQPTDPQLTEMRMPRGFATNTLNNAWLYVDQLATAEPVRTTGSIELSAVNTTDPTATVGDRASLEVRFVHPLNNDNYTVTYTNLTSTPQIPGGVALTTPVFGANQLGAGFGLPQTFAYIATYGMARIMRGNTVVAQSTPAYAFVTQAIHEEDGTDWLNVADPTRLEIHLFVPGNLIPGGEAVETFPNGFFYMYWPGAAMDLMHVGGVPAAAPGVEGPIGTPAVRGRGPVIATPRTLDITLTNDRIVKDEAVAPFGLYRISLTNASNRNRGLYFSGTDLCCTEYHRYSNVLRPGQTQSFMFYFAPGKVVMRDFLSARKTQTAYVSVDWGPNITSIVFE